MSSTNSSLSDLARAGAFRSDLLYRLAVASVELPALGDHAEDIPALFQHLLRMTAARHGVEENRRPSADYLGTLAQRPWPGNVRELRILAELYLVGIEQPDDGEAAPAARESLQARMECAEREAIMDTLIRHRGHLKASYEELGVSRKTLDYRGLAARSCRGGRTDRPGSADRSIRPVRRLYRKRRADDGGPARSAGRHAAVQPVQPGGSDRA